MIAVQSVLVDRESIAGFGSMINVLRMVAKSRQITESGDRRLRIFTRAVDANKFHFLVIGD